jgi:transposase
VGCRDSLDVGKERMEYGLLFRWFVGLGIDEVVWDATTFTNHCGRLLASHEEAQARFGST